MVLFLTRTYFPDGTNGILVCDGTLVCYTIELPWQENQQRVSCIPEGNYFIVKRYSAKYRWHLEVVGVPNRRYILFHPANCALRELQGCIAPVTTLSGPGCGQQSVKAFQQLKQLTYPAIERGESVTLTIH
ncbi:DUF5675 family protein [Flavobacterium sp. XGLA_31]|uniref:DUF5675 family protein n=1 Tax=Flavobacterium sp. XGLA_31 TaxID=3447666 RepID=UPI003F332E37